MILHEIVSGIGLLLLVLCDTVAIVGSLISWFGSAANRAARLKAKQAGEPIPARRFDPSVGEMI